MTPTPSSQDMDVLTPLAPIDTLIQNSQDEFVSIEVFRTDTEETYSFPADCSSWEFVGRGSFGYVHHYFDPRSSIDLAIKAIPTGDNDDYEIEKKTVQNEISIHRRLSHPNIVKYFTTKQIENAFLIFMEYVDGRNMFDALQESGTFNNNVVIDYTYQILSGLVYMHNKEIVHRDLRSKNILISSANVIKITDFGISKSFTETHCSLFSSQVGNPHWRAPELIEGKGKAGRKVDVWSVGIAMFEMICGDTPWGDHPSEVAQYHIYKDTKKLPLPADTPRQLQNFVSKCLERECDKRLHSKELIMDPMFDHYRTLERSET